MTRPGLSILPAIFPFLFSLSFLPVSTAAASEEADKEKGPNAFGRLPLYFIENKGQVDPRVRFYVKTPGQTLYFTDKGIVFDLARREEGASKGGERPGPTKGINTERLVFSLGFENARESVLVEGLGPQDARVNYFVGNDKGRWRRGIPTYRGVIYRGVYQGIDLRVFGKGKGIEYEFIVNPGGNPDHILLTYSGIEKLSTNREGELLIATAFGDLKETRPYIYQDMGGERAVDGSFHILTVAGQSQTRKFSYGFQVGPYDPSHPLVIDPTLTYSTYFGGSHSDGGADMALDVSGNIYITGWTQSADFPTKDPFEGTIPGGSNGFIAKFSSSGSELVYSTYFGGSRNETVHGIAVDGSGSAYVTGCTDSTDFPVKDPYQGTKVGGIYNTDVFVSKFSPSGNDLVYSTYLGGKSSERGYGIAVDGEGSAYITGYTNSTGFPVENAYQEEKAYGYDVFITKFSSSGKGLYYSTYLGGDDYDEGFGIAVDESGNAYVTGFTFSSDFPTINPFQKTISDSPDAFITKLSSSGAVLLYSTYLGGNDYDEGYGIAVDPAGRAYVTGSTDSTDFPVQNPYQASKAHDYDAFITKLTPSGNALLYSTYLGGDGRDVGSSIAVDGSGNACVAGSTKAADFPTENAYQAANAGEFDAFVAKLPSSGGALVYSTYLGGSVYDYGYGIALDGSGNVYVTGSTSSPDFPTQNPLQGTNAGWSDAFVAILSDSASLTLYVSLSGYCGGKSPCYQSIQKAIDKAGSGAVIMIARGAYDESLLLGEPKALTLSGGWDSAFTAQDSYTTVNSMTVSNGTATVDRLVVH